MKKFNNRKEFLELVELHPIVVDFDDSSYLLLFEFVTTITYDDKKIFFDCEVNETVFESERFEDA